MTVYQVSVEYSFMLQ